MSVFLLNYVCDMQSVICELCFVLVPGADFMADQDIFDLAICILKDLLHSVYCIEGAADSVAVRHGDAVAAAAHDIGFDVSAVTGHDDLSAFGLNDGDAAGKAVAVSGNSDVDAREEVEIDYIKKALQQYATKRKAAKFLGSTTRPWC